MKIIKEEYLIEMSNVRGAKVKNPEKLPFSFYFSASGNSKHSIRVKVLFDPEHLRLSKTGTLKLCDNWAYIRGKDDKNVSSSDVKEMKEFFRKYLVFFCAVWDEQLEDGILQDYFEGDIDFKALLKELSFYDEDKFKDIDSVEKLEEYCRNNNLVNFYGN